MILTLDDMLACDPGDAAREAAELGEPIILTLPPGAVATAIPSRWIEAATIILAGDEFLKGEKSLNEALAQFGITSGGARDGARFLYVDGKCIGRATAEQGWRLAAHLVRVRTLGRQTAVAPAPQQGLLNVLAALVRRAGGELTISPDEIRALDTAAEIEVVQSAADGGWVISYRAPG